MSHVRDMSLAESGRMKIRWVQDYARPCGDPRAL